MNILLKLRLLTGILFFFFIALQLKGQGWEHTFGGASFDIGEGIALTNDGGYIITGAHVQMDSNNTDVLLLKLDEFGETEWSKTYGGTRTDWASSVLPTDDGGYLIGASTRSSSSNNAIDFWVIKTDSSGNMLWENLLIVEPEDDLINKVIKANDGGYIVIGTTANIEPTWNKAKIIKLDENGNILWTKIYQAPTLHLTPSDIIALSDGSGYAFCGSQDYKAFITKIDNVGNVIFNEEYIFPNNDIIRAQALIQTDDGGFITAFDGDFWTNQEDQKIFILKTDSNGILEWSDDYGGEGEETVRDITRSANGNYCFLGTSTSIGNNYFQAWLMEIDVAGNIIWERHHGGIGREYAFKIKKDKDNGFVAVGSTNSYGAGFSDVYYFKTDSLGYIFSNYVEGNVFEDLNTDCLLDANDVTLEKWLVRIAGDQVYETLTDEDGYYKQNIPPGDYTITIHPPNNYWEASCFASTMHSFSSPYEFLSLDIPVTEIVDCPFLEVDIATSSLRICTSPKYNVNYCNTGSATAENAYVEVLMDQYIQVDSASIPIASQVGDLYTFDLGNIDQSECGDFKIYTSVSCDTSIIGYTHCVEANIFPDSLCINPDSLIWQGASLMVTGTCDMDSIRFVIRNIGTGATASPREYIIIEDDVMRHLEDFELEPNDSMEVVLLANGATIRLEVEQEEGHPGNSAPSIVVQACGENDDGNNSQGFVNIFSFNEGDASTSIFCSPNVYPFDPNDKQGFPNGYREEHSIEKGQDLEYLIRFQNTGNAEAFTVSIVDTLSSHLEIASLRLGASSHDYDFEVFQDNVIRFTFKDINLPDSTTNFDESQGFVQFKIQQKGNTQIGDIIYNSADIYFDFATPVKTNETWHTIGEDFIEVLLSNEEVYVSNLKVISYPNPFRERTTILLEGAEQGTYNFSLYNMNGQLLKELQFENEKMEFERDGLPLGIYFYTIASDSGLIATGKMIIQ